MSSVRHSVAERLAELLVRSGVEIAFGFPGETTLPYYVALQSRQRSLRHVLARSPGSAGYMADAYARISGRIGVCDAPGGIGSPHLAPALHEARNSSVPLLVCASGVARTKRGRWSTSECRQQELFAAVAKRTFLVDEPGSLDRHLNEAIAAAASPPTGPVFLEIPADVLAAPSPAAPDVNLPAVAAYPSLRSFPDPALVARCARLLAEAKSPVIVAGGGVHLAAASDELARLVEASGLPVATTLNGKNALPEAHARSLGVTGAKGHAATNRVIEAADCVLVLGSKLGDKSTNSYAWPRSGQVVIQVDCDPRALARLHGGYVPILSDIATFLSALTERISPVEAPSAHDRPAPFWPPGLTDRACRILSRHLPSSSILVADASVASGWAGSAVTFGSAGQRLLSPRGSGSIGYALPAAIGAQFARPGACVVGIGGDGGFAMAMHEMETVARYRLPITFLLLNNRRLGLIDRHAAHQFGGQPVSAAFGDPDWMQIARSFGWDGVRVETADVLDRTLPALLPPRKPTLVELRLPPNEDSPDFMIATNRDTP